MLPFRIVFFWLICLQLTPLQATATPSVALVVEDEKATQGYDFIGAYQIESVVRVRAGIASSSPIASTVFKVYSNGAELRVFQVELGDTYIDYAIYRSDGISEQNRDGSMVIKPGIHARHVGQELLKQVSLTQRRMTITQFPAISDTVVITYAKRVELRK